VKIREYLLKLEDNLMTRGGRWVADFTESFWGLPVGDTAFDMVILGNTRPRGFLLSRFFSWVALPNYPVACFAYSDDPDLKRLSPSLKAIAEYREKEEMPWAWLVIVNEGPFSRRAKALVEKNDAKEIGVALVDLASQEITASKSYIGRRMGRIAKRFK